MEAARFSWTHVANLPSCCPFLIPVCSTSKLFRPSALNTGLYLLNRLLHSLERAWVVCVEHVWNPFYKFNNGTVTLRQTLALDTLHVSGVYIEHWPVTRPAFLMDPGPLWRILSDSMGKHNKWYSGYIYTACLIHTTCSSMFSVQRILQRPPISCMGHCALLRSSFCQVYVTILQWAFRVWTIHVDSDVTYLGLHAFSSLALFTIL